jgi:membrane protein
MNNSRRAEESGRVDRGVELARAVVREFRAENLPFLAGSIAYHAFVSLLPLFLLLLTVVGQLRNAGLRESVVRLMEAVLTPGAADPIIENVEQAGAGVSLIGLAFLLWGTLRIFRGLDTAFSDIYESESENTFLDQIGDGLLVLATFALAVIGAVVAATVLPLSAVDPITPLVRGLFLVAVLAVVFFPMYYVFPDEDVGVVEVLPGVVLAAVGLTTFEGLFGLYVGGDSGNIITSILLLLTWLYVSGLIILLGAVVNAVLSNRSRDVSLDPVFGGVERTEEAVHAEVLVRDLEALDRLLAAAEVDHVVVEIGDERIRLPLPEEVEIDTEVSKLTFDTSVGVEFNWWPR